MLSDRNRHLRDFHELMRYRIMDILLVASPYDAFLLEEAGHLAERVLGEFRNLDLHYGPGLTTVSTAAEALARAQESHFGLVISTLQLRDMSGAELARRMRAVDPSLPVVLLAFDNRELKDFLARNDVSAVEGMFLWQGDARILLAIVKSVEDRRNVAHDVKALGVQVILVVEDNIRYYSSFLPMIYGELLQQSQRVIREGANLYEKITRMRARPKILLCGSFEEAWEAFTRHQEVVLGIISDVEFPKEGRWSETAGLELARLVKERWADVPVILHSARPENEALARGIGADFLLKGSPLLLAELRRVLAADFGFGDFVFRMPDGREAGRAQDLKTLEERLRAVPAASIAFHAEHNHFSRWLKARTEFALAHELRSRRVADFPSLAALRRDLLESIDNYRRESIQAVVVDFDSETFDANAGLYRIGGGSLGGKARGLAFVRQLLAENRLDRELRGVEVVVPQSVVLATDVFDTFLEANGLREFAIDATDDEEVRRRFLAARLPDETVRELRVVLRALRQPLAVRSSSLLEDSQHQPFSGVYETVMLANTGADEDERLERVVRAIKRVYASTFSQRAKGHIRATPYRLEEEKMAVILQRLVGASHRGRFYPDMAGVARSHNFYPHPPQRPEDGIAAVALGLGRTVVEEGAGLRFCPRYPRHLVERSTVSDLLENAQRSFWALDLEGSLDEAAPHEAEVRLATAEAEADGTLAMVASTYSPEDDTIHDGTARSGVRVVTFAPVLKQGLFPLAEILDRLLELGAAGLGGPVEIEFAVNLAVPRGEPQEFGFLQLRPFAVLQEAAQPLVPAGPEAVLCRSDAVLGNGRIVDIHDVVLVDRTSFDRAQSRRTAQELAAFNADLVAQALPYLLIGIGRWGSSDPWLGIPVTWDQISGARVIVESGFADLRVAPSQGSHFFQNLTSFNVGYFTVNPDAGEGQLDWTWLEAQPVLRRSPTVRHLRFERPVVVAMDGRVNRGLILKP
jgi:CheY-like chemotaxis protein